VSLSKYRQKKILEALKEGNKYVQLHVGNPGETGTGNVAAETKRKKIEFGAIESEEQMKNSNIMEWLEVAETEEITHFSVWDAEGAGAGNCEGYGELTAKVKLTKGQTFRVKAEKITLKVD
jgi:hypothetical protein